MFIAPTADLFKARFAHSLKQMLTPDGLGAFILVLANSMQDAELHALLGDELFTTFTRLKTSHPAGPEDDQSVFAALATTGINSLTPWEQHKLAPWEVVVNPLRSLRPARVSSEVFSTLHQPFNPERFHFNKPFLRPEILWEGIWNGTQLRVLYNKFPFAPWHLLVVPEPARTLPQYLTRNHHALMMALVAREANRLPGLGMAFNSLGAYASVNQLHFQGFVRATPFPVELPHWQHNGGSQPYPLQCWRSASVQESWRLLERLHQANQPYNLLYRAEGCYILPRKGQGTVALPAWAQGIAWHEACGVFTLADSQTASQLDAGVIASQLARLHHRD